MCNKYNGWTNYPTWNVMLWIDNDEYMCEEARRVVQKLDDYDAEKAIKEWIEEMNPVGESASMWTDIMSWALAIVDWHAIVKALKEE